MISNIDNIERIHLVGIGGISMSALAKYCLFLNKKVSGSDRTKSDITLELEKLGAKVFIGDCDLSILKPDLVVYTSAVAEDNIELQTALKLKIPLLKRTEFLSMIMKSFESSICVCGCHGKTTVTSMITHIFMMTESLPTSFIGGKDMVYDNFFFGENKLIIAEACEYKKNFLYLNPKTVVCTNIDNDHPDSYNGIDDIVSTFKRFAKKRDVIANADDLYSYPLCEMARLTFGINKGNVRAENIQYLEQYTRFDVVYNFKKLGTIKLRVKGRFNVYNALSSICVGILYGVDFETIKQALERFLGIERRMEYMGRLEKIDAFCDYAHHPKEISESIKTFCDDKTLVVFQPHTYSRTEMLFNEFVKSLIVPTAVIIYKTYPAREEYSEKGDGFTLYKRLSKIRKQAYYAESFVALQDTITKIKGDFNKIIFFGAGDIYNKVKTVAVKK